MLIETFYQITRAKTSQEEKAGCMHNDEVYVGETQDQHRLDIHADLIIEFLYMSSHYQEGDISIIENRVHAIINYLHRATGPWQQSQGCRGCAARNCN